MSVNRSVEQFAFAVVRHVLNVTIEEYDVAGRQAAVDALLHYPDGRLAALEVSSVGPEDEARITNSLDGRARREVTGLQQTWWVQVPRSFHPADLRIIDQVLIRCEALGIQDIRRAAGDAQVDDLARAGVRAWAADAVGKSGPAAWITVEGIWGYTTSEATDLPEDLAAVLETEKMQSKVAKLAATGLDERHLFLHVRPSAFSFSAFMVLAFGGELPGAVPQLPEGLTQVWLVSGWKMGGLVRAISGHGWERTDLDDPS